MRRGTILEHALFALMLSGAVNHRNSPARPIEIRDLPKGEAPEHLRQPLLKGRKGKRTRSRRRKA